MISEIKKQITVNAVSVVEVETPTGTVSTPIVYMSASVQSNGKINIAQSIQNEELYLSNLNTANDDYNTFYQSVLQLTKNKDV